MDEDDMRWTRKNPETGEMEVMEIAYSQELQLRQIEETRKLRLTILGVVIGVVILACVVGIFALWYVHDKQWLTRLFKYLQIIAEVSG